MGKMDVIAVQKAAVLAGQDAALQSGLEAVWDESALEQKASDGTLGQADLDAAVAAAVAPLNDMIAALKQKDEEDIKAGQDALVALQGQLSALSQKEGIEAEIIAGLQGSLSVLQDVVAKLAGLGLPVPPAPVSGPAA